MAATSCGTKSAESTDTGRRTRDLSGIRGRKIGRCLSEGTNAKQAKDGELIGYATEIKLRAERKAGQLLAQMAERGERRSAGEHSGNQYSERFPSGTIPPKLEDLGVSIVTLRVTRKNSPWLVYR
jgi:hypothetical protein